MQIRTWWRSTWPSDPEFSRAITAAAWVALLGFVLVLPSLALGLYPIDDIDHRRLILSHLHGQPSPGPWYDLYQVVPHDPHRALFERFLALRPWWSLPELQITFFRPLSVATLYLDYLSWPDSPWLMHLHSAAWYFAAVFSVVLVCARLSREPRIGILGGLLYAVDDAHVQPVAWLAHRNALIGTTFAASSLLLHAAGQREPRGFRRALSALCLLLALLSAENSIAILGFIVAYAVCLDRSTPSQRVLSLLPAAIVTLGWFGLRRSLGYAVHGSGFYLDPVASPAAYLHAAGDRYLALLHAQFAAPWSLDRMLPGTCLLVLDQLGWWLVLPMLAIWLIRNLDRDAELRFWALAALTALLPLLAAPPHGRLLMMAGMAWWMLCAHMLWAFAVSFQRSAHMSRWLALAALSGVLLIYGALSSAALAYGCYRFRASDDPAQLAPVLGNDRALTASDVFVINAPDQIRAALIPAARLKRRLFVPRHLHVLGTSLHEIEVTRTGISSFELFTPPGYLIDEFASFWRGSSAPLHQGERVNVDGFQAQVLRTTPDARPLRVRFTLDKSLDDASLRFIYWHAGAFDTFRFAPIGQRRVIPADFDHSQQLAEELVH
jgi:hypothetical protein